MARVYDLLEYDPSLMLLATWEKEQFAISGLRGKVLVEPAYTGDVMNYPAKLSMRVAEKRSVLIFMAFIVLPLSVREDERLS